MHTIQAKVILAAPGVLAEPDERLLRDVLAGCGASTEVQTLPVHRGESTALTWIVLAVLPLQAFLAALGSKLADDGYAQVRALVKRLAGARGRPESPGRPESMGQPESTGRPESMGQPASTGRPENTGRPPAPLVLVDPGTGVQIVLEADLPAAAYHQLTTLDLSQFSLGPVHYDLARGCWRAELDEAAPPRT